MTSINQENNALTADEQAIRQVIEARRLAWNAQDLQAYQALLGPDAELTSATGRTARGRADILHLYVTQRASTYRDAVLTLTEVDSVDFIADDVACVEATFELQGMRASDGAMVQKIHGRNTYIMARQSGQWVITSMKSKPAPQN